jgi:hypothetical protein
MPETGVQERGRPSREHMQALGRAGAKAKKVAAVEWRIRELVESAPELTDAQRQRLSALLKGAA